MLFLLVFLQALGWKQAERQAGKTAGRIKSTISSLIETRSLSNYSFVSPGTLSSVCGQHAFARSQ